MNSIRFLVLIHRDELRRLARFLPFTFTCLLHGFIEPCFVVVQSSVMINWNQPIAWSLTWLSFCDMRIQRVFIISECPYHNDYYAVRRILSSLVYNFAPLRGSDKWQSLSILRADSRVCQARFSSPTMHGKVEAKGLAFLLSSISNLRSMSCFFLIPNFVLLSVSLISVLNPRPFWMRCWRNQYTWLPDRKSVV